MTKSLLKEMVFLTEATINFNPHRVISNRIRALKRKPFEHDKVARSAEVANRSDYPHETQKDTDM